MPFQTLGLIITIKRRCSYLKYFCTFSFKIHTSQGSRETPMKSYGFQRQNRTFSLWCFIPFISDDQNLTRFEFMTSVPRGTARSSQSMHGKALSKGLNMVMKSLYDTDPPKSYPCCMDIFLKWPILRLFITGSFANPLKWVLKRGFSTWRFQLLVIAMKHCAPGHFFQWEVSWECEGFSVGLDPLEGLQFSDAVLVTVLQRTDQQDTYVSYWCVCVCVCVCVRERERMIY